MLLMIDVEKLEKPYEKYTIRSMIPLICDYCGCSFMRVKKSTERLNANCKKDSCGSKECTKLKKNDVNINLFGSNDYFTSETFKEKQKETNLQKFGTEEYFDSDDFKNKRKETLIERYGVDSPLKDESIKEKQKETVLNLYGKINYAQTEEYKERLKSGNIIQNSNRELARKNKLQSAFDSYKRFEDLTVPAFTFEDFNGGGPSKHYKWLCKRCNNHYYNYYKL